MNNIVIIGAGISGLASAYYLKQKVNRENKNINIIVLEKQKRVGGTIKTENHSGFIFEAGPRGFLGEGRKTLELSSELGIWDKLVISSDHARTRYAFEDNKLLALKGLNLLNSIGIKGFVAVVSEIFKRNKKQETDESVYKFIERRFSSDIMERFVELVITGVYAGNPKELSAKSIFPKLTKLEEDYGSIIKGLIKSRKDGNKDNNYKAEILAINKRKLISYKGGLQTLINSLEEELRANIMLSARIEGFKYKENGDINIRYSQNGQEYNIKANKVFFATPAYETARYIEEDIPSLASILRSIEYSSISVVCIGFKSIVHNYKGFGFLSGRKQGLDMLGCIWNEMVFPNLAPSGMMNLTAMYGGAHNPHIRGWDENKILSSTKKDLALSMNIRDSWDIHKMYRYAKGIPQYNIGHENKLADITGILERNKNIFLTGNYLKGIGMNDCIRNAFSLVKRCKLD